MSALQNGDNIYLVGAEDPAEGTLVVTAAGEDFARRYAELMTSGESKVYSVCAFVADHIPLFATVQHVLTVRPTCAIAVNNSEQPIYLHRGGRDAVFFTLVRGAEDSLDHVRLRASGSTPQNALIAARSAVSALLDSMVVARQMPLEIVRLEIYEDGGEKPLAFEFVYPYSSGVRYHDIGGIWQFPLFAPYLSALREALAATSPYYRLLCAWRVYDGVKAIRTSLRDLKEKHNIPANLPKDPRLDVAEMERMGASSEFVASLRTAADLFNELDELRQAAAHFELRNGTRLDLSRGENVRNYSIASALLLRYSWQAVHDLRMFYSEHLSSIYTVGSVLPLRERQLEFIAIGE